MEVKGSRCLVVGGGRGLGREIALALAAAGAAVAVSYRYSAAPAAATVAEIEALGGRGVALAGAVGERGGAHDIVGAAALALGGLDAVVFAVSGPFAPTPPHEIDEATWDATVDAVAKGFFFTAVTAHDVFVAAGRPGVVVAITDVIGAVRPNGWFAAHAAAKAGQAALVASLAKAWADDGVRVCGVAPGPVALGDDPRTEASARAAARGALKRLAEPSEIAAAVRFCLENDYFTGQSLVVDGGLSLG